MHGYYIWLVSFTAVTIAGDYYIWLLLFRAFVILTGEITGVYTYLQHLKKFAGAITIPGGYYSWVLFFRQFAIITGRITCDQLYLQHSKYLQVLYKNSRRLLHLVSITQLLQSLLYMKMGRITVFHAYTAQGKSQYLEHNLQQNGP